MVCDAERMLTHQDSVTQPQDLEGAAVIANQTDLFMRILTWCEAFSVDVHVMPLGE